MPISFLHFSLLFLITLLNLSLGFVIACHCGWGPVELKGWLTGPACSPSASAELLTSSPRATAAHPAAENLPTNLAPQEEERGPISLAAHSFSLSGVLAGLDAALTTSLGTLTTIHASLEQASASLTHAAAEKACADTNGVVRDLLQRMATTGERLGSIRAESPGAASDCEALTAMLKGLHGDLEHAVLRLVLFDFTEEAGPNAAALKEEVARIIQMGNQAGRQFAALGVWEPGGEGE